MRYGSVCSGIEAATQAWHPLGWEPQFFSEIETFPNRVLQHHYPTVPNLGDMTKFREWPERCTCENCAATHPQQITLSGITLQIHACKTCGGISIDLLVAGTPCQSFSQAGLREGLNDPRGQLMLTFGHIAARYRPRWLVWENVPGVFSSDEGRAFASLLGLLSGQSIDVPENGWQNAGIVEGYRNAYGLAWRVLDAQFVRVESHPRAVPQRRRRVFVVGYLGDWRRAAAVLFERESMRGDSPPRREAGQRASGTLEARTRAGGAGWLDGGVTAVETDVARPILGKHNSSHAEDQDTYIPEIVHQAMSRKWSKGSSGPAGDEIANLVACPLTHQPYGDNESRESLLVVHSLRAEGHDASEDGAGRGVPLVVGPTPFNVQSQNSGAMTSDGDALAANPADVARALDSAGFTSNQGGTVVVQDPIAFRAAGQAGFTADDVAPPITSTDGGGAGVPTIAFNARQDPIDSEEAALPLDCFGNSQAVSFQTRIGRNGRGQPEEVCPALNGSDAGETSDMRPCVATRTAVRRLTPLECERLQGFRDHFTRIPNAFLAKLGIKPDPSDDRHWSKDGPRYKALGNSKAINCVSWIGQRIAIVDTL